MSSSRPTWDTWNLVLKNKIKHINRLLGHSLNVINSPAAPKWPPWIKLSPYLLYSLPGLSTSSNPLKVELVSPCLALGTVFRYQKSHWGRYAHVGHSILVLVFMDFFFLFLSSQAKALWYTSVIPASGIQTGEFSGCPGNVVCLSLAW